MEIRQRYENETEEQYIAYLKSQIDEKDSENQRLISQNNVLLKNNEALIDKYNNIARSMNNIEGKYNNVFNKLDEMKKSIEEELEEITNKLENNLVYLGNESVSQLVSREKELLDQQDRINQLIGGDNSKLDDGKPSQVESVEENMELSVQAKEEIKKQDSEQSLSINEEIEDPDAIKVESKEPADENLVQKAKENLPDTIEVSNEEEDKTEEAVEEQSITEEDNKEEVVEEQPITEEDNKEEVVEEQPVTEEDNKEEIVEEQPVIEESITPEVPQEGTYEALSLEQPTFTATEEQVEELNLTPNQIPNVFETQPAEQVEVKASGIRSFTKIIEKTKTEIRNFVVKSASAPADIPTSTTDSFNNLLLEENQQKTR